MTGGLAWVYDADGSFVSEGRGIIRSLLMLKAFGVVDAEAQESLKWAD